MFKLSVAMTLSETGNIPVALFKGGLAVKIKKAVKAGYSGIEIMSAFPENIKTSDLRLIKDHGLEIPAFGTGGMFLKRNATLMSRDKKKAEEALCALYTLINVASLSKGLINIGSFKGRTLGEKAYERYFKTVLKEALAYANRKNVRIAIEPINRYETDYISTVAEGLELIKAVKKDNFGMVLDTFHMNIEEPDVEKSVMKAGKNIFHVHLGDSNRWPPGYGHFDFKTFIKALRKAKYDGFLSAELLQKPDADTAGFKNAAFIKKLI